MGGEQTRQWKHLLLYLACVTIGLFLLEGCMPKKGVQGRQAEDLMMMGNYKAALKKSQELLKQFPHLGDQALFQIGLVYAHPKNPDKDYKKALRYFRRLIKEFPKSHLKNRAEIWISLLQEVIQKDRKIQALTKRVKSLQRENRKILQKINALQKQTEKLKEIDLTIEQKKRKSLP